MIYTPYFVLYWSINHTPTPYIPLASPEKATEAPCLRRSVSWIGLASSETDMVFSSAIIGKNDWHEISQIWWRTEISASDCVWDRKLTPRAETRGDPYWAYFVLEDQSKVKLKSGVWWDLYYISPDPLSRLSTSAIRRSIHYYVSARRLLDKIKRICKNDQRHYSLQPPPLQPTNSQLKSQEVNL